MDGLCFRALGEGTKRDSRLGQRSPDSHHDDRLPRRHCPWRLGLEQLSRDDRPYPYPDNNGSSLFSKYSAQQSAAACEFIRRSSPGFKVFRASQTSGIEARGLKIHTSGITDR
jgi:hypothetical protein